jgi:uncharacterized protein (TIGR03435 family)
MKRTGQIALMIAAFTFAVIPLLSQTAAPKPSFDVVSIKPSAPNLGIRGGGPRGDRFAFTGASLRMLLQQGFQKTGGQGGPLGGQLQIIGGPAWMDSDRYDIQAKADCSGGALSREQSQLMIQSMLEDRFQLKAHMETRELPIYNLIVAKDGPKLKVSEDQTPPPITAAGPPQVCGPAPVMPPLPPPPPPGGRGAGPGGFDIASMPRGAMMIGLSPTGMTMQATSTPFTNFVNMLQQFTGRPVVDKTDLKGLFDFKLTFSPEGVSMPGFPGGTPFGPGGGLGAGPAPAPGGAATTSAAADPIPSLFTAVQELGLRLESSKGPVEVLVVDSAQKPTEN